MQAHNIMEDIVRNYLDEMLSIRFDVCTCDICRQNMLAYTLSRVPAQYVTSEIGAMHTLVEQIKVEQSSKILRELIIAIQVVKDKPRHEKIEDDNQTYHLLLKQIKLDRGADFSHYREGLLKRRIALRMKARKVRNYSEYLQVLTHTPGEYEELFTVLTINVSSFFRDKDVWTKLKVDILPAIIAAKKRSADSHKIRIWSAGCSHGEEPYSLAILLYELLEKDSQNIKVEIVATDIDKDCLNIARNGIYGKDVFKEMSAYCKNKFFLPVNDGFQIVPKIKELVVFKERNLIHDEAVFGVDMVICRNVFIYFNRSLQEHLIMKFHGALLKGGYFVMGMTENLLGEARHVFHTEDGLFRVYQKI